MASSQYRKKCISFLPHLHLVHLSSKPDTSALKLVWGVAIVTTKSPCGLGHLLKFSILLLWQNQNSRGQTVRTKLLWVQSLAESTGAQRPLSDGSAAFLKPCWHSQFASQTLATRTIRRLDFENRRSLISLLGLSMWSHYAEKGQISLNLAFSSPKWIDAQWQASQQLCSPFMYSLMWGSNPSPDSDKGPQMQVIYRLT